MFFPHRSHPYADFEQMTLAAETQHNNSSLDEERRLQPILGLNVKRTINKVTRPKYVSPFLTFRADASLYIYC